jgi:hypothetical protein
MYDRFSGKGAHPTEWFEITKNFLKLAFAGDQREVAAVAAAVHEAPACEVAALAMAVHAAPAACAAAIRWSVWHV